MLLLLLLLPGSNCSPAFFVLRDIEMDDRYHVVVGVAGAGKTAMAMDLLEQHLKEGLKFWEVGFLSFSRAACSEAVSRAAKITGEAEDRLTASGYYKTIHAAAVRALGIDAKTILDPDSKDGQEWYTEYLGVPRGGEKGTLAWRVGRILEKWDIARQQVWEIVSPVNPTDSQLATPATPVNARATPDFDRACARSSNENTSESDAAHAESRPFLFHIGDMESNNTTTGTRENGRCSVAELYNPIWNKDLRAHTPPPDWRCAGVAGAAQDGVTEGKEGKPALSNWIDGVDDPDFARDIVGRFERAKLLWGRNDFTDILMKYAGLKYHEGLLLPSLPVGSEPDEVKVWFVDEAQDCSQLLWLVVDRLANQSEKIYLLGDPYQSVYRFLGADPDELLGRQNESRQRGSYTHLNRTWRNPAQVIEWGESVLSEQESYRSRNPFSEHDAGSVGLVEWNDFVYRIHDLANIDTLILGRTWFSLEKVQRALNERGIPWASVAEKHASKWQAPAKLAFVLVMRELIAGIPISEQDWRRVTETLPQKFQGEELFRRGEKAKWKKFACSHDPQKTLAEVEQWGATPYFQQFATEGRWKEDMFLLIDHAIEKYGIDAVRKPRIRLGTAHAVKGMEAKVVYCLAASTEASQNADPREECCLKYVTITRASADYRLVVDDADVARGKPLFWAAPKDFRGYDRKQEFIDARIKDSEEDHRLADLAEYLVDESPPNELQPLRDPGPDSLPRRQVPVDGSQNGNRQTNTPADAGEGEDLEEWWNM